MDHPDHFSRYATNHHVVWDIVYDDCACGHDRTSTYPYRADNENIHSEKNPILQENITNRVVLIFSPGFKKVIHDLDTRSNCYIFPDVRSGSRGVVE